MPIPLNAGDEETNSRFVNERQVVYKPRFEGGASLRLDNAGRSVGDDTPLLAVLAPDHVGLTLKDQPSLYWFQSEPSDFRFELTLVDDRAAEPVLAFTKTAAETHGIQELCLEDHDVKLALNVEYKWYAALVRDEENRSRDVISSGIIKRTSPSLRLMTKIVKTSKLDLVYLLAEEGIWYDALAAVSELIDANPENRFRDIRSSLLEQADLADVAAYDRSQK